MHRALLIIVVFVGPRPCAAQLVPWSVDARLTGEVERDRPSLSPDGRASDFDSTERLVLSLGVEAERFLGEHVTVGGRADTGDLTWGSAGSFDVSGQTLGEEARRTAFLRELWLRFETGDETTVGLEAGRRRLELGQGLLLDDYTLGGALELARGAFDLRLGAAVPGAELIPDGPPLLYATLGFNFGFRSRATLLYARDTGAAAEVKTEISQRVNLSAFELALDRGRAGQAAALRCLDPPPETEVASVLHWFGASLAHAFPGGQLEATWLTVVGHFDTEARLTNPQCVQFLERRGRPTSREIRTDVLGHALAFEGRYHVAGPFYPGLFALWMSGEGGRPGEGGEYDGFLAIAPFPRRPAVFFDVGATSSLRTPRAATSGLDGRGVLAVGPTLLYAPTEDLSLDATAAWLQADAENPGTGGRFYGPEFDLRADWDVSRDGTLFAEVGALPLGDFHPERRTVWQISVGCLFVVEGDPAP